LLFNYSIWHGYQRDTESLRFYLLLLLVKLLTKYEFYFPFPSSRDFGYNRLTAIRKSSKLQNIMAPLNDIKWLFRITAIFTIAFSVRNML